MSDPFATVTFRSTPAPYRELDGGEWTAYPGGNGTQWLGNAEGGPPALEIATSVRAHWSERHLFIVFDGAYVRLRTAGEPTAEGGRFETRLWEKSDVYEFFIGNNARATGRYAEFQLAPDGRLLALTVWQEGSQPVSRPLDDDAFAGSSIVDTTRRRWLAIMQIPWETIGGNAPTGAWHCNAYRASGKFHGDELLALSPTGAGDNCFHRFHRFADLEIVD